MPKPVRSLTSAAAWVAVLMLTAIAWTAPSAAATDSTKSAEYLEDARNQVEKGDVRAAIVQLKNALQSDSDNVNARLLLGQLYLRVGDGASSEKELRTARKLGAPAEDVLVDLGRAYLLQNKNQEVLDEITNGDRAPEIESSILVLRGNANMRLNQVDEAEQAFAAANEINPEDALAKLGTASVWRSRGKLKEAEAAAAEAAVDTAGGEVILVVEDDDRVRRTTVGMLRKQGYRVEEAHNSAAALDIVAHAPRIDLLFTDVVLPDGLNGPALAREILSMRPDIRVLLTSGYAFDEGQADAGEPHFRLLPKPYRRGDLAKTIRSVLDEPSSVVDVSVAANGPGE